MPPCVSVSKADSGWYWCLTFHHIQPEPKALSWNISRQTKGKGKATNWKQLKKCPTTATHVIPLWWVMFVTEAQLCFFWAGVASCGSSQRRCYNELAKALCMQSMQHAMCLIHHLYLLTCLLFAQESNQTCWYVCPHSLCLAEVWTLTVQGYSAVQHSPAHR